LRERRFGRDAHRWTDYANNERNPNDSSVDYHGVAFEAVGILARDERPGLVDSRIAPGRVATNCLRVVAQRAAGFIA
jgi:hypothetical protein